MLINLVIVEPNTDHFSYMTSRAPQIYNNKYRMHFFRDTLRRLPRWKQLGIILFSDDYIREHSSEIKNIIKQLRKSFSDPTIAVWDYESRLNTVAYYKKLGIDCIYTKDLRGRNLIEVLKQLTQHCRENVINPSSM